MCEPRVVVSAAQSWQISRPLLLAAGYKKTKHRNRLRAKKDDGITSVSSEVSLMFMSVVFVFA